ncbi:hypothetical protein Pelo_6025 [Pelomyxa schiedti]|nr:hypothetical protein Pelo_6025 [Pelomyxa schiedti]
MSSSTHVGIKDATYARSQFIALGAAVIVGRCGHNNSTVVPASTLTPPVLSLIGREWVVFPAKRIAIDLTSAAGVGGDGGGTDDDDHHELITLSVSPTLGLVDAPRVAHIGSLATNEFCGWVGPAHSDDTQPRTQLLSVGSESGAHCGRGERFALVRERTRPGVSKLGVIDTARNVPKMSLLDRADTHGDVLYRNRKWAAVTKNWWNSAMSLWNFDGIESGIVTKAEDMDLPWPVHKAEFDDADGSLVVAFCSQKLRKVCYVMFIDLDATLEQKSVIGRQMSVGVSDRDDFIDGVLCWKGRHYVLLSHFPNTAVMLCLETGKRTQMGDGTAQAIGGPYFAVTHPETACYCREVFSVLEPTKVCCAHEHVEDGNMLVRKEVVVRDTGARNHHHRTVIHNLCDFCLEQSPVGMITNESGALCGDTIEDATCACDQFISLAAGVIVGRCGRDNASPASALTPSSLSHIGREWVVFPARHVVISGLTSQQYEFIRFSVSPTLGLVDQPATFYTSALHRGPVVFCGWVGPLPRSHNGAPRFALMLEGDRNLRVLDSKGQVDAQIPPVTLNSYAHEHYTSRRWFCIHNRWTNTLSGWNFDDLPLPRPPARVSLPLDVKSAAFGDGSLVVSLQDGDAVAIEFEGTLAQRRLVSSPLGHVGDVQIRSAICWRGLTYALPYGDACIMCLNTGQRTPLHKGEVQPIGGPYFVVTTQYEGGNRPSYCTKVYSVVEPTKVLCTHQNLQPARLHFGNEMVVRNTDGHIGSRSGALEMIDAVSGFVVFKLKNIQGQRGQSFRVDSFCLVMDSSSNGGDTSAKTTVTIKDATYARSQFIALGVGVIVGRCAGSTTNTNTNTNSNNSNHAPVSTLTPPLLSLIGREWVMAPAKTLIIRLASRSGTAYYKLIKFSVSPTLGLVRHPGAVNFRRPHSELLGFVGPASDTPPKFPCVDDRADRFALARTVSPGVYVVSVIDTWGQVPEVLMDFVAPSHLWCMSRRWAAVIRDGRKGATLSLWNFDGIESGVVDAVEKVGLPWHVEKAAFDGDDRSLVVASRRARNMHTVMVIDLGATLAEKRVIETHMSFDVTDGEESINSLLCWRGKHYALFSDSNGTGLLSTTTGRRTLFGPGTPHPIGGPYFAILLMAEYLREVHSVLEPTKVFCVHPIPPGRMFFTQELAVRDTQIGLDDTQASFDLIDAASGFIVCRVACAGLFLSEVT